MQPQSITKRLTCAVGRSIPSGNARGGLKLGRKLRWDPAKEAFLDDTEANATRSRPQRAPYGTEHWLKSA